jgi:hypothetical protein
MGKWDEWYASLREPRPYGDMLTYVLAARFLQDCEEIEDWGCGAGWFRRYVASATYRGIDGSTTPFADVVADLIEYHSSAEGILLRHVLEHNERWHEILANAVASFTRRLVVVLFTPIVERTRVIAHNPIGVPNIAFALDDITCFFRGFDWSRSEISTFCHYRVENVFYVERRGIR